jgi:pimeloyl-ACP methyl ester carboxylesterase
MKTFKQSFAVFVSATILLLNSTIAQSPVLVRNEIDHSNQINTTGTVESKTIVFITGAFVSNTCWDEWRTYFESKGYKTLAPPWPGKDADAATLRARHPDAALAAVTLNDVLESYTKIIESLPEKPILIGHSFGGAISQILLNRDLAVACVGIHAAPPKGVFPYELKFLRSGFSSLGLFTSLDKTYMMPFKKFQFAFVNGMPLEEQQNAYDALAIPESKRAARGGLSKAAKVDFKKEHPPLLLLAGTQDQIITDHLCKRVYKKYKTPNSITDYVVKDRNHFVLGLPTWKEDADFILKWINALPSQKSESLSTY